MGPIQPRSMPGDREHATLTTPLRHSLSYLPFEL
jgi:hypothetical protein